MKEHARGRGRPKLDPMEKQVYRVCARLDAETMAKMTLLRKRYGGVSTAEVLRILIDEKYDSKESG